MGTNKDGEKETSRFTHAEELIRHRLNNADADLGSDNQPEGAENSDDDNVSVASSVADGGDDIGPSIAHDIEEDNNESSHEELTWETLSKEKKVETAACVLKNLGNVLKKKLHKHATVDLFS